MSGSKHACDDCGRMANPGEVFYWSPDGSEVGSCHPCWDKLNSNHQIVRGMPRVPHPFPEKIYARGEDVTQPLLDSLGPAGKPDAVERELQRQIGVLQLRMDQLAEDMQDHIWVCHIPPSRAHKTEYLQRLRLRCAALACRLLGVNPSKLP